MIKIKFRKNSVKKTILMKHLFEEYRFQPKENRISIARSIGNFYDSLLVLNPDLI